MIQLSCGLGRGGKLPLCLSLAKLEIFHNEPARISRLLSSLGLEGPLFSVSALSGGAAPQLLAHINTPQGQLSAPNQRSLREDAL